MPFLKAQRPKTPDRNKVSQPKRLPAPTQGWYVGANIAEAPEGSAYYLENVFPDLNYCRVRRGSQAFATGMPSAHVDTLMPYQNGATSKMFAGCSNKIYDVSSAGAVGAAAVSGLTNTMFNFVQFAGLGGSYLIAVNGADSPQVFDGTGWNRHYTFTGDTTSGNATVASVSSTTGLVVGQTVVGTGIAAGTTIASIGVGTITLSANATASNTGVTLNAWYAPPITTTTNAVFSNISIFKNRVYLTEANSLNVWYLGVQSIGGAATLFPMQGIFKFGGYIVATATWAIDSTSGIYESFIVLTSEGEVAMYNGSDPSGWTLAGLYKVSKPLGPRCMTKTGGDLAIMTEDGIVPMSKVQTLDQIALQNSAITKPIQPAWVQAVQDRAGLSGWQLILWPLASMGIVNLPKMNTGDKTQYIVNARTGAWASYVGWDANCFAVYNDNLYFGSSDGRVMQAEVGGADDGSNYTATVFPSFTSMNSGANRKQVKLVKPYIQSNIQFSPKITVNVDYDTSIPAYPTAILPGANGAKWDSARWDIDVWPLTLLNLNYWQSGRGWGVSVSPILQVTLSTATVTPDIRLIATDMLFEDGNIVG